MAATEGGNVTLSRRSSVSMAKHPARMAVTPGGTTTHARSEGDRGAFFYIHRLSEKALQCDMGYAVKNLTTYNNKLSRRQHIV